MLCGEMSALVRTRHCPTAGRSYAAGSADELPLVEVLGTGAPDGAEEPHPARPSAAAMIAQPSICRDLGRASVDVTRVLFGSGFDEADDVAGAEQVADPWGGGVVGPAVGDLAGERVDHAAV